MDGYAGDPATPQVIPQRYEQAVPLAELTPHPLNANQGDVGLVSQLLADNGFAGAVLAQESTGLIIDGETRWRSAQADGMDTIPVLFLDVDDDTRDRLLASINESTRRGVNDESKLVTLLKGLAVTPKGLRGAAFDGDDLDSMVRRLQAAGRFDVTGEWDGMPGYTNSNKTGAYSTVVHFRSHDDAHEFFKLIERPLTRSLWWPQGDGHVGSTRSHYEEIAGGQEPSG
jgi:hypothetical protein